MSPKVSQLVVLPASSCPEGSPDADELAEEIRTVRESSVLNAMLAVSEGGLLVLGSHRRILAASIGGILPDGTVHAPHIAGLRPGDALECRFNARSGSGCGASDACRDCGIAGAVLASQTSGEPVERECLLTVGESLSPLELRVRAAPLRIDGRSYTVVALRDISHEKRRESLEQVFFHDLMNTVAALSGWIWTLARPNQEASATAVERVTKLVEHLGREVAYQRALLEAERGTLKAERTHVAIGAVLTQVQTICAYPGEARKCSLVVDNHCPAAELSTDPLLLERVLVNMVKNAVEATSAGGTVRLACEYVEPASGTSTRAIRFRVHNDAFIPDRIAHRIFQRSFSTKHGKGRGLGTYSMKLLGERYLGGRVDFVTSQESGTDFFLELDALIRPAQREATEMPVPYSVRGADDQPARPNRADGR